MTNEETAQETTQEPVHLPVAPAAVRHSVLSELDHLVPFVQSLTPANWNDPSAVEGWDIGDVVTHLSLALGLYRGVLEAGARGWGAGGAWRTFGRLTSKMGPAGSSAFNAVNNAIPRAVSGALSPEVLQGQFAATARKYRERVAALEPAQFTQPIHYMGRPWPLSYFLAVTLNEMAIHRWDIQSRLQRDAVLSDEARAVLPGFYWSGSSYMLRLPAGTAGMIQTKLRDPETALWWSIEDGKAKSTGRGEIQADVTVLGEAGTFVLVVAGRIPVEDALRTTSLTIDGDNALAHSFLGGWHIV